MVDPARTTTSNVNWLAPKAVHHEASPLVGHVRLIVAPKVAACRADPGDSAFDHRRTPH